MSTSPPVSPPSPRPSLPSPRSHDDDDDDDLTEAQLQQVALHVARFELLVEACRSLGIAKFAYGDVEGGGRSAVGSALVYVLRQKYTLDYSGEHVYFVKGEPDPDPDEVELCSTLQNMVDMSEAFVRRMNNLDSRDGAISPPNTP